MDFDGVVERYGHYIVFETKEPNKEIPKGQLITLEGLRTPKSFCVMKIWGKDKPEYFEASYGWINKKVFEKSGKGVEEARDFVKRWYEWANQNGDRQDA